MYTPFEAWRQGVSDDTINTGTYRSVATLSSDKTSAIHNQRKYGQKFDTWSLMISLWELINLSHPFQNHFKNGNLLEKLRQFKFDETKLHFHDKLSKDFIEVFGKILTNETENIDGEEVPVGWGVQEIIKSEFYQKIKTERARLKRVFYVFIRLVEVGSGGLTSMMGLFSTKINFFLIFF